MSRIARRFSELKAGNRRALIPYITAGDPRPEATVPVLRALVASGADILELGVPFSDPMADGPVIQRATERALRHGVSTARVLEMVREFRRADADTPIVLMGYLNPIEVMGYTQFAEQAKAAGVDGVLTVDLPPEEADPLVQALAANELDAIFLAAPTSDDGRIARIARAASGFIYYVSLRGVTGAKLIDLGEVDKKLKAIRRHSALPLGVGFGISGPEAAAQVAALADAVIVGSALVSRIEKRSQEPTEVLTAELGAFVAELRGAIDKATMMRPAAGIRA